MVSKNRSAQVMLEYLVMVMLVLAAVIYGGPVLVNSIGAHFRIAEDNVGDAFGEKMKQSAAESCSCNPKSNDPAMWPAIGCGPASGCGALEMKRRQICFGCGPTTTTNDQCVSDKACCEVPVPGGCGTSSPASCVLRQSVAGGMGFCMDANQNVTDCLTSERSYTAACGGGVTKHLCQADTSCTAPCTSTVWKEDPSTVCAGKSFIQTGDCPGATRPAVGTGDAQCLSAASVTCGDPITSICGGTCSGTGTKCPLGYECKNGGCQLICDNGPSGVYMAAHYYSASDCGSTPSCNTSNVPANTQWVSISQTGGSCGVFHKWHHTQCGTLYRVAGQICHGDSCVVGMVPNGGEVTFHLGTYNGISKTCDPAASSTQSVNSSGFAFAGNNGGYGGAGSLASWGN